MVHKTAILVTKEFMKDEHVKPSSVIFLIFRGDSPLQTSINVCSFA